MQKNRGALLLNDADIKHQGEASRKERPIKCNDRCFVGAICSGVVVTPPSATRLGQIAS